MELDLSLIEMSGDDDDSLLRLEDPCPGHGILPCSPVHARSPTHPDTASRPSLYGGLRTVQFADNYGGRNSKVNIDVNVDGTKLNMDPLQMKRTKKAKGYNMRKSLAWNKAFFTEEGVLDPEELSLVTGTFNLSNGEPLSVIQEQKTKPGRSCSPHFHSLKEKVSTKSPAVGRGLSPRCESSARYRVSPAKEISSPQVQRLILSAQDANRTEEKHSGCPRPKPSSQYKRSAITSKSSPISKEPKLTKSSIPRADRCTLPTVPRSALPKASFSSRIPGVEAKRVASSPKSISVVGKGTMVHSRVFTGSLVNTRGVKGTAMNNSGVKAIEKAVSCPKPSSLKEPAKQPGLNKSKLPPRAPTQRDPQISQVVGVTDLVHQPDGVCNKQNNISLQQKCFPDPDDAQRQVSRVQAGKPTGLRVPSPSLGFFGQPKQTASVGDSHLCNISKISSYYPGARNLESTQRPLQAPEMVSIVSNGFSESDIREPLLTANSGDIKTYIPMSTSSLVVQADILEELPQPLTREFDRNSKKPSGSRNWDESLEMEALRTYDNLRDIEISYYEPLKHEDNQGKADNSCGEELLDSLSIEEAEMSCCSDIQQKTYGCQRSMFGSDQPSEEGTEGRKCDSREAHLKGCKDIIEEQMHLDASSPKPKFGQNQELVAAARKDYLKDGLCLEDCYFSAAVTKGSCDHSHPLMQDKQKCLDDRDQPSTERADTRKHDSCEALPETYNESLDGCTDYDPSHQDESIALDVVVHACLTDSRKDCNLSVLEHTYYLSRFKPFTPIAEGNIVEDINSEVHGTFHLCATGLRDESSLGMLNSNSGGSSHSTMDENQFGVSELKALESEPNCPENFQLTTCNSEVLQKPEAPEEEISASNSHSKDNQSSFVEAEVFDVNNVPSPGAQTDSEHEVEDRHQKFSVCDIPLQMTHTDGMADEAVLLHAQNNEIVLHEHSHQVTELQEASSDIYPKECRTNESRIHFDLSLLTSESDVFHRRDCSLAADNGSTLVDGDELSSSSSKLKVLEKTSVICKADAYTTINYLDLLSSDGCSPSETSHLNCSDDQFDMPDAALDVALQKQSSAMSYSLDDGKLEMNVSVTETAGADNDTISSVPVEIQDDTSSDLGGNCIQHPSNTTTSISKPNCVMIKPPPDAVPFSDEWLAAIEAAGEGILTLKSGAVQHSPTEKSLPVPSPWSPVKRNKNQGLGPFDCTKHTSMPGAPADD